MAFKIPASLKVTDLKRLAFLCGISTSGTKTALTQRLIDEVVPVLPSHGSAKRHRILSVDMGIRNLAYCVLDKHADPAALPEIKGWRRMAVSSVPDLEAFPVVTKESFDPPTLAAAAYNLLRNTLLPYQPDFVLIERQRFRSSNSPHILEWTVRVNMLESMLHAVMYTLKAEKAWQGSVIPILPKKVGPFWLEPVEEAIGAVPAAATDLTVSRYKKTRNTKNTKLLNKGAKIDLVKHWLESGDMVSIGANDVENTAKSYLEKWHRPGRGPQKAKANGDSAKVSTEEIGKLDDLADSLLQGMAWIQWEQNKTKLLKEGVESLGTK